MARVVITAVVVEDRSKSAVARDYGVSRRWVQTLAVLQGGLLLAQVQQDTRPLQTAVDTLLALTARSGARRGPRSGLGGADA